VTEKKEPQWEVAAQIILEKEKTSLHYTDIATKIIEAGVKAKVGATPAKTLYVALFRSIKDQGENSPFLKVGRGLFALRELGKSQPQIEGQEATNEEVEE